MWPDDWQAELSGLRNEIDRIDSVIVELVSQRMKVCERIGGIKSGHGMPIYVPQREAEVIRNRQGFGVLCGLSEKFVRVLFRVIMHESRRRQGDLVHA
ncbi:MAG: chorismate mutase [Nitrospirota bacterium]